MVSWWRPTWHEDLKPSCFLGAVAVVVLVVLVAGPRCFMGCIWGHARQQKRCERLIQGTLWRWMVWARIISEVTEATTLKIACNFSNCKSSLTQVLNILNMNKRTSLYSVINEQFFALDQPNIIQSAFFFWGKTIRFTFRGQSRSFHLVNLVSTNNKLANKQTKFKKEVVIFFEQHQKHPSHV